MKYIVPVVRIDEISVVSFENEQSGYPNGIYRNVQRQFVSIYILMILKNDKEERATGSR